MTGDARADLVILVILGVEFGRLGVGSTAADVRAAPGFAALGCDTTDEELEGLLRDALEIHLFRSRRRA